MSRMLPLILLLLNSTAFAEIYRWVDSNGRVQYSDQVPPGTEARRVGVQPATGTMAAPAKTYQEQDQESRKRQVEKDEAAKKQAGADQQASIKQKNCATARGNLATLQAGGRIARYNEKGEKEYLDEKDVQAGLAAAQKSVSEWCN
jgi:hypothetical protein